MNIYVYAVKKLFLINSMILNFQIGGNDKEHLEYMIWRLDRELNLTDEQKDLIKKIQKEVKEKHKELEADCNHEEKIEKVKELIKSENLTEYDILAIIDENRKNLKT